jgi:type VI secretion system protein ImpJ
MRTLSKVVWHEGMHLAQHHFQVQSRYLEDSIAFALSQLFFKPYGLGGYELDAEALRNGTVAIIHARGVMPDGLAFHFPEVDPPPPTREIRELFSPTQDSHVVFLAIPPYRAGQANCALGPAAGDAAARYLAETTPVADDVTGRDEKPVSLGRKNFRLLLDVELADDLVALALARVRRDGAGNFIYDPDYIPPLLQVGASEALMDLLRRVIEILDAKSEALAGQRGKDQKEPAEHATRDVASFWLAHAIHSSLAPLRNLLEGKRSRPEQAYAELARLAGALCTFALDSHPRTLPTYDHDRLGECFGALERHIRTHLGLVVPTNCVSVPLERTRKLLHTGAVRDQRCFGPSQWVLGVRSAGRPAEVLAAVPALVKVCAGQHIVRLVSAGLPGLGLEHLPSPPSAVPRTPEAHYFAVGRTGPCWEAIVKTGEVGVYAPEALADAQFELHVVLESGRG